MGSDDEMMLNLLMEEEANAKIGEEEHFITLKQLQFTSGKERCAWRQLVIFQAYPGTGTPSV
jgi:hypothetical protein